MQVAEGYIARQLPISVIVIDFFHWVHQVITRVHIVTSKGLGENEARATGVNCPAISFFFGC